MKDCARYAPMIGARPGELAPEEARGLDGHLAACVACRGRLADLRATEGLLAEALLGEARRRDFAPFVDGVMARIAERRSPAGILRRLRGFRLLHPRLALGAALAPVAAAVAIVLYVSMSHGPEVASVLELNAEGNVSTIIQTSDGPVVLMNGDDEPEGS